MSGAVSPCIGYTECIFSQPRRHIIMQRLSPWYPAWCNARAATLVGALVLALSCWDSLASAQSGHPLADCGEPQPQIPGAEEGRTIPKLLLKLETEIYAGQLLWPPHANASETLQDILALGPELLPSDLDEIRAMASRFDCRAWHALMNGEEQTSKRYFAFRDALSPVGASGSTTDQQRPPAR
jgi:hypothetical protein